MPRDGTFAQYVAVPVDNVYPKPARLSMEEAAAIPLAGLTAYRAVFTRGALQPGETVLITGVGGGVQTFVLLFAKHAGARAIVTSSSDEKLERAKALGADLAINYASDARLAEDAALAEPIDLVVDSSGGETLRKALDVDAAGRPHRRSTAARTAMRRSSCFRSFGSTSPIVGTSMGSPQDFAGMLELFGEGLRPVVDRVFALDDAVRRLRASRGCESVR